MSSGERDPGSLMSDEEGIVLPNASPQGFGLQCNLTLMKLARVAGERERESDEEHREENMLGRNMLKGEGEAKEKEYKGSGLCATPANGGPFAITASIS